MTLKKCFLRGNPSTIAFILYSFLLELHILLLVTMFCRTNLKFGGEIRMNRKVELKSSSGENEQIQVGEQR